jgi:hypothetical protein
MKVANFAKNIDKIFLKTIELIFNLLTIKSNDSFEGVYKRNSIVGSSFGQLISLVMDIKVSNGEVVPQRHTNIPRERVAD